jgi:hypothetical protein
MEGKSALLYKALVVGVIVLFVGMGVQPAFAVTQDTSNGEDDCNLCAKKVSTSHPLLLKILKDKVNELEKTLIFFPENNGDIEENVKEFFELISEISDIKDKDLENSFKSEFCKKMKKRFDNFYVDYGKIWSQFIYNPIVLSFFISILAIVILIEVVVGLSCMYYW